MIEILEYNRNLPPRGYEVITDKELLRSEKLTHIIIQTIEKTGKAVGSAEILAKSEELNNEV